jgi:hypothetical protein
MWDTSRALERKSQIKMTLMFKLRKDSFWQEPAPFSSESSHILHKNISTKIHKTATAAEKDS